MSGLYCFRPWPRDTLRGLLRNHAILSEAEETARTWNCRNFTATLNMQAEGLQFTGKLHTASLQVHTASQNSTFPWDSTHTCIVVCHPDQHHSFCSLLPEGTWPMGQHLILALGLPGPCFVRTLNSCLAWTIELFSNFIYLFILIQTLKRISFKKQLKLEVHQALGYLYSASQLGKISFQNGSFLGNLLYDPSL